MAVAGGSWLDQTMAKYWSSFARTGRVVSRNTITVTARSFEQDPSFSGPSGIFDWRLVSSIGTRSLFLGLNYPINQEITNGKDHDGSAVSFIRQNCVYTAYHASLHEPYPDMCRRALEPKVGQRVTSIRLRPAGWSFPRQAHIWFKPSTNLHSLIHSNV